jgi:hypothetical protein
MTLHLPHLAHPFARRHPTLDALVASALIGAVLLLLATAAR